MTFRWIHALDIRDNFHQYCLFPCAQSLTLIPWAVTSIIFPELELCPSVSFITFNVFIIMISKECVSPSTVTLSNVTKCALGSRSTHRAADNHVQQTPILRSLFLLNNYNLLQLISSRSSWNEKLHKLGHTNIGIGQIPGTTKIYAWLPSQGCVK